MKVQKVKCLLTFFKEKPACKPLRQHRFLHIHIHWLDSDMSVSCQREQYNSIETRYLRKRRIYETPLCLCLDCFVVDGLL